LKTEPICTGRARAFSSTCQQIEGGLPANVHPSSDRCDRRGWVYEYVLVITPINASLAELRSIQDWYLRYQLETVPGVAEVATIGDSSSSTR